MESTMTTTGLGPQPLLEAWREAVRRGGQEGELRFSEWALLHVAGRSGLAGQYQGERAIIGFVDLLEQLSGGTVEFTATRVVRGENHAILLGKLRAGSGQTSLKIETAWLMEFQATVIREIWMFCQGGGSLDQLGELSG